MISFIHHSRKCKPIYSDRKQLGGYWGWDGLDQQHSQKDMSKSLGMTVMLPTLSVLLVSWLHPWGHHLANCALKCMPFTRYQLYFSAAEVVFEFVTLWTVARQAPLSMAGILPGILQARILEWVAISSSKGSSRPRDGTCVSGISCISRWILYHYCHLKLIKEGKFSYWEKLKIDESQKQIIIWICWSLQKKQKNKQKKTSTFLWNDKLIN